VFVYDSADGGFDTKGHFDDITFVQIFSVGGFETGT
jgi:hypothetical protein